LEQNGKSEATGCNTIPTDSENQVEAEEEDKEDEEEKKEQTYEEAWSMLKEADGILVPGGFGDRGIEVRVYLHTKRGSLLIHQILRVRSSLPTMRESTRSLIWESASVCNSRSSKLLATSLEEKVAPYDDFSYPFVVD